MRKEPNSSSEDISSNSENFLDNSPIDENSPSSGLADDHMRHTISELKIELDVAEEIKQDLEISPSFISIINFFFINDSLELVQWSVIFHFDCGGEIIKRKAIHPPLNSN